MAKNVVELNRETKWTRGRSTLWAMRVGLREIFVNAKLENITSLNDSQSRGLKACAQLARAQRGLSGFHGESALRCPNRLASDRFYGTKSRIPWYLLPLRLFVHCVKCDSCLQSFYRVKVFGWLFRRW